MDQLPEPTKNPDTMETDQLFYSLNCAVIIPCDFA